MIVNGIDCTQFLWGLAVGVCMAYMILRLAEWSVRHRERKGKRR